MTKGLITVIAYQGDVDGEKVYIYARYDGRLCTHRHTCVLPLSLYWVQELRNDPAQFEVEEVTGPEAA